MADETKKRILLVEDEEALRETLALNLQLEGYMVDVLAEGTHVVETFMSRRYDLIILDIMLPGKNGLDICREIRKINRPVFILFLSARSMSNERIEGLKTGADDYLTKPFSLEELLLRVEILLKRLPATGKLDSGPELKLNGRTVVFDSHEVIMPDLTVITLSKKEVALLKLLNEKRNEVVSREEILERIWANENFPTHRTIDNFIVTLRKIFEFDPRNPQLILSVRGVGYRLLAQ